MMGAPVRHDRPARLSAVRSGAARQPTRRSAGAWVGVSAAVPSPPRGGRA